MNEEECMNILSRPISFDLFVDISYVPTHYCEYFLSWWTGSLKSWTANPPHLDLTCWPVFLWKLCYNNITMILASWKSQKVYISSPTLKYSVICYPINLHSEYCIELVYLVCSDWHLMVEWRGQYCQWPAE